MNDSYKYDVAISFLEEDEQLALEIADRIRDRVTVNVFVYSERQTELAGTDGVDSFSSVFGDKSRVVVVLYREQWGKTSWTRVEENAIRTRGFHEGHEFVLLVKLDSTKPPVWLPPTRIWFDFDRYRIDGVATVVEERVQVLGGTVHRETVVEAAARLGRQISFRNEMETWRSSSEGAESAKQEAVRLVGEFQSLAEEISRHVQPVQIDFMRHAVRHCVLYINDPQVSIEVDCRTKMQLLVALYQPPPLRPMHAVRDTIIIEKAWYDASLDRAMQIGWRESEGEKRFFTSIQLAANWVKRLLKEVERLKLVDEDNL